MMILDQIIQKKTKTTTKTTTKQPKTSTHCFLFLWTGQGTFLVQDFHRPNGAKILRFGNFPETLTYLGSLENCQKSKSFSKIWLWKSWNFGYFLDRTRISQKTTPLSIHLGSYDHDGGYVWSKKLSNLIFVQVKAMCAEFGEVTVIIGLVINFLAFRLTIVRIS